jgi:PadR family transcriptional regulator PadR
LSKLKVSMTDRADFLQGTLDLLILRSLSVAPLHGWGISKRIRLLSDDVLQVNQGSLYPALYRMEDRGLVTSEWKLSDEGRRAKFYRLTATGRKRVGAEQDEWRRFVAAVEQVLQGS